MLLYVVGWGACHILGGCHYHVTHGSYDAGWMFSMSLLGLFPCEGFSPLSVSYPTKHNPKPDACRSQQGRANPLSRAVQGGLPNTIFGLQMDDCLDGANFSSVPYALYGGCADNAVPHNQANDDVAPTVLDSDSEAPTIPWTPPVNRHDEGLCNNWQQQRRGDTPSSLPSNYSRTQRECSIFHTEHAPQFENSPKFVIYVENTASEYSSIQRFLCFQCNPTVNQDQHSVSDVPVLPYVPDDSCSSACSAAHEQPLASSLQAWRQHASHLLAQRETDFLHSDFWDRWSVDSNGTFTHRMPSFSAFVRPNLHRDGDVASMPATERISSSIGQCREAPAQLPNNPPTLQARWDEWSLDSRGQLQPARMHRKRRLPSESRSCQASPPRPASPNARVMNVDEGTPEEPHPPPSPSSHASLMDLDMLRWAFDLSGGGNDNGVDDSFQPTKRRVEVGTKVKMCSTRFRA